MLSKLKYQISIAGQNKLCTLVLVYDGPQMWCSQGSNSGLLVDQLVLSLNVGVLFCCDLKACVLFEHNVF